VSVVELALVEFYPELGMERVRSLVELVLVVEFHLELGWRGKEVRLLQNPDHKVP